MDCERSPCCANCASVRSSYAPDCDAPPCQLPPERRSSCEPCPYRSELFSVSRDCESRWLLLFAMTTPLKQYWSFSRIKRERDNCFASFVPRVAVRERGPACARFAKLLPRGLQCRRLQQPTSFASPRASQTRLRMRARLGHGINGMCAPQE